MHIISTPQTKKRFIILGAIVLVWTMLSAYAGARYQIRVYKQQLQKSNALLPNIRKIVVSSGQVTALKTEKLTIKDIQGKTKSYTLTSTTGYIQNGKPAKVTNMQQGDTVRIIPEQSNPGVARQILIVTD